MKNGFWQRGVPGEIIEAIGWRAPVYCTLLEKYMEGSRYSDPIHRIVKVAGKTSMTRDLSPLYRSSPKRSDLYVVRRFIEFSL